MIHGRPACLARLSGGAALEAGLNSQVGPGLPAQIPGKTGTREHSPWLRILHEGTSALRNVVCKDPSSYHRDPHPSPSSSWFPRVSVRHNLSGDPSRRPAPLGTLDVPAGPPFPSGELQARTPPEWPCMSWGRGNRLKANLLPLPFSPGFPSFCGPGELPPPHSILGSSQRFIVYREWLVALSRVGELLLFGHSVVSSSLQPHALQHTRLPCPSLSPELVQTHVHWVDDAIQPVHLLSSPSPPALNFSQHQGLFQLVSSSHQVAKVLELQLQHLSFQWIFRVDFL